MVKLDRTFQKQFQSDNPINEQVCLCRISNTTCPNLSNPISSIFYLWGKSIVDRYMSILEQYLASKIAKGIPSRHVNRRYMEINTRPQQRTSNSSEPIFNICNRSIKNQYQVTCTYTYLDAIKGKIAQGSFL